MATAESALQAYFVEVVELVYEESWRVRVEYLGLYKVFWTEIADSTIM